MWITENPLKIELDYRGLLFWKGLADPGEELRVHAAHWSEAQEHELQQPRDGRRVLECPGLHIDQHGAGRDALARIYVMSSRPAASASSWKMLLLLLMTLTPATVSTTNEYAMRMLVLISEARSLCMPHSRRLSSLGRRTPLSNARTLNV